MGYDYTGGYVDTFDMAKFKKKYPGLARDMKLFESELMSFKDVSMHDMVMVFNALHDNGTVDRALDVPDYEVGVAELKMFEELVYIEEEDYDAGKIKYFLQSFLDIACSFKNITNLSLVTFYCEDPLRGSEVNAFEWEVLGLWELTPAGKKMQDMLIRKFFCY